MYVQSRLLGIFAHSNCTFFWESPLNGSRKFLLDYLTSSPIRLIWISYSVTCKKAPAEATTKAHWAYCTCTTLSILVLFYGAIWAKIKTYIALRWKGLKRESQRELFNDLRWEGMWWRGHASRPLADCWNQAPAPRALTFCPLGPRGHVLCVLIL